MAKSLETLSKLRKLTVDQARRHLKAALLVENAARTQADAADARIGYEGEIASDLSAGDHAVEAFAAWLPTGRAAAAQARAQHERSLLDVARARAGLNAALTAAEAADGFIQMREREHRSLADGYNQRSADETAIQNAIRKSKSAD